MNNEDLTLLDCITRNEEQGFQYEINDGKIIELTEPATASKIRNDILNTTDFDIKYNKKTFKSIYDILAGFSDIWKQMFSN